MFLDTSEQPEKSCYIACSDKKRADGQCDCHNRHKQYFSEVEELKPGTIVNDFVPAMPMDAPDPNVTLLTFIDCKTAKWFAWRPVKLNSGKFAWLKWVHRHDIRPVTYQGLVPFVTYSEIPNNYNYDANNHSSTLH